MNLVPWIVVWAVLAAAVIVLAGYRKLVASHEDDSLHVSDRETALVAQQEMLARKLDWIDRWGQILTVIALVYGLALASGYVYLSWIERNTSATVIR
jgi:hypothetical protein